MTNPGILPQVGDEIEVSHEGFWHTAKVTQVTADRVMGEVTDPAVHHFTQFTYTIDSYRTNWRWALKKA